MREKISVLVSLVVLLLLINNINAAASHTLQVKLKINNTVNNVYIPGTGHWDYNNATYTNPKHFYLASYVNDTVMALVFSFQNPLSLRVNKSGTSHYLTINQNLTNSKSFLVFTKGDQTTIENRIGLIEAGTFLLNIAPSFAYGLGLYHPIKILLTYTDIDVQTSLILQTGYHELEFESNSTDSKVAVVIRRKD